MSLSSLAHDVCSNPIVAVNGSNEEYSNVSSVLGSNVIDGSVHFRVWIPHVSRVNVLIQAGPLWDKSNATQAIRMQSLGNDYWYAVVDGLPVGSLYRYQMEGPRGWKEKLDPAARDVVSSELTRHDPDNHNAAIVVTSEPHPWVPFKTPAFENFNIYQFHVGTFTGRNDGLGEDIGTLREATSKFGYIRELGFNCIQPLPVQEFAMDRSWGYNPASYFAPESAYGDPEDLKYFVDTAHRFGLAVIFDVVYNHAGPGDNVLWEYGGYSNEGGVYFEGGKMTPWGRGPAWWKKEVQEFFYQNARMYLEEYNADGLRFDATTQIDGNHLKEVLWRLQQEFPEKYMIAEHLPAHPWITTAGNFDATWVAKSHHECQRALDGNDSVNKILGILGWDGFAHSWNNVKYTMGSHDDIGDDHNGNANDGIDHWDKRHRCFVDLFGGRDNWHARAKCRLAFALNVTMPGTPMMFMGSECHMGAPSLPWGYWHDGVDARGDHRFDWSIAGDSTGIPMRRMVTDINRVRWNNSALRSETLDVTHIDHHNRIIAFKRWDNGNVILTIVNLGEKNFGGFCYGVSTGNQFGQWTQVFCSQDAIYGGWDGAGNAFHQPSTQPDQRIYVNVPKWSVTVMKLL